LADSLPKAHEVLHPVSDFYREEFVRCQRCLEQQREYYSERTISEVERALTKVMSQLDRLCSHGDAERIVSRLLQQFDIIAGLSSSTDPRQIN